MLPLFHRRLFCLGMWLWRDTGWPDSGVRSWAWNSIFGVPASPETKPGLLAGLFVFRGVATGLERRLGQAESGR
jgi:hypothetical protein